MGELHANVPQYTDDLQRPVTRIFDRLRTDRPCWRTNWNVAWNPQLLVNPSRYPHRNPSLTVDEKSMIMSDLKQRIREVGFARAAFLKVEYQTLRRLPEHSNCLLFTVRTFLSPFTELERGQQQPGISQPTSGCWRKRIFQAISGSMTSTSALHFLTVRTAPPP